MSITADAIIDNRSELFDKLGIDHSERHNIPDSLLILRAYQKWSRECPQYLLGDFSFAIWDEKQRQLFCEVDHNGTRALYYYHSDGLFAFSTLIKPLFTLREVAKVHNKAWFADFLAMPGSVHQLEPELTPYQNIDLLPAGHTLTVKPDRIIKKVYWQLEKQPELKLSSDRDYEEALREILGEAVRSRLRSTRPVAVMMSGGLDSTSVACLAARELAGKGRRLRAFSAVPTLGYRDCLPAYMLADETPFIEAVKEYNGNIDVTYCRSEGEHSLSDTCRLLKMLEQPYKIFENLFWIDSIMAEAKEQGSGVLLKGSAGNVTISWGPHIPYLQTLLQAGQWRPLFHESWAFARRFYHPYRKLYKIFLEMLPYNIRKIMDGKGIRERRKIFRDMSLINPDFARSASVQERFRRFGYDPLFIKPSECWDARVKRLSPNFSSHVGVISTKHALAYGMALRDPTADKRVIEFCFSVPDSQYVRGGRDRFLLRRAMNGILPDKVRLNEVKRGRQSADWNQRLQASWPELAAEIRDIGTLETERQYLDIPKIQRELARFRTIRDDAADDPSLAHEHDVGVVLSGGAGNATISWGELMPYLLSLCRSGKWPRLLRESWDVSRPQPSPLRAMYRLFRRLYHAADEHPFTIYDLSPINPSFAERAAVADRFHRFRYQPFKLMDSLETRKFMLSTAAFSHLAFFTTKHGLANRMALRDPTMDKRVIEFCLSVPEDQYVRDGRGRNLIRRAMAGIIPDKVRLNETVVGIQAADWAQRLEPHWPELKDEISKIGALPAEREYLDIAKIQRELAKYSTLEIDAAGDNSLRMLVRSLIFSRFLRQDGVVT